MTVTLDATVIAVLVAWSALIFWLGRRSAGNGGRDLSGPPPHMVMPSVKTTTAPPPSMQPAQPSAGLSPQALEGVRAALSGGNKILAIKLYRVATGVGLAEAKAAVEAMER